MHARTKATGLGVLAHGCSEITHSIPAHCPSPFAPSHETRQALGSLRLANVVALPHAASSNGRPRSKRKFGGVWVGLGRPPTPVNLAGERHCLGKLPARPAPPAIPPPCVSSNVLPSLLVDVYVRADFTDHPAAQASALLGKAARAKLAERLAGHGLHPVDVHAGQDRKRVPGCLTALLLRDITVAGRNTFRFVSNFRNESKRGGSANTSGDPWNSAGRALTPSSA